MYKLHLIKELCEKKNIKLKELAAQIGLTPEGLTNIIKSNSTKIPTLEKIAKVLGVEISYFMDYGREKNGDFGRRIDISAQDKTEKYQTMMDKYIEKLEENAMLLKENALLKEKLARYEANEVVPKQNKAG
jgi:transcriptional regulator with XRE-family HTH domain